MLDTELSVADRFGLLDVEFLTGSGTSSSLLEVLTVLALLRPEVWRLAHWRPVGRGS